jgi:hypothetical protein
MRLSANILQSAEQRTNPLGEREILLRSLAIPAIEHLAVTRDQFDAIDMSNNHLSRLDNLPRLERLSCLYLGGNGIDIVDGKNLRRNVPGLKTLVLTGNGVRGWNVIADLGGGCPKLEFLSLVGNPVTSKSILFRRFVWIARGDGFGGRNTAVLIYTQFRCREPTRILSFCSLHRRCECMFLLILSMTSRTEKETIRSHNITNRMLLTRWNNVLSLVSSSSSRCALYRRARCYLSREAKLPALHHT